MIMRLDRLQAEIPPPSDPDPNGASIVQELLGGKFGEMSTFMNYTYQSFNFRNRQGARPFYDLVASIAAEEFGHIELVSTAINTMLTGALDGKPGKRGALKGLADCRNSQQFLAGAASATVQDSMGKPWSGDYVNATGDLIGDLTHNFFLETGARNNKLKVYEAVDHPAARALTGYLLVRGGVHQVAYARALENLTGAKMEKLFPTPRIPTDKIPECRPHIKRGEHLKLYRWSPDDFKELAAVFNGPHPETGEELEVAEELHPEGAPAYDLPRRRRSSRPGPTAARSRKSRRSSAWPRGCRKSRPGWWRRKAKSPKPKKRSKPKPKKAEVREHWWERSSHVPPSLVNGSSGGGSPSPETRARGKSWSPSTCRWRGGWPPATRASPSLTTTFCRSRAWRWSTPSTASTRAAGSRSAATPSRRSSAS